MLLFLVLWFVDPPLQLVPTLHALEQLVPEPPLISSLPSSFWFQYQLEQLQNQQTHICKKHSCKEQMVQLTA